MQNLKTLVWSALLLICVATSVLAAPFAEKIQFTQPNGTAIVLFGEGDEFYAVFETLDGYTVVFNQQTKSYDYAQLSTDGSTLISSGLMVGRGNPKTLGLALHLRINQAAAKKQVQERFQKWDQAMQVSTRWKQAKAARQQRAALSGTDGPMLAPPTSTTTGTKVGLTILIDFSDDPATIPQASIIDYCNGDNYTGYSNNGSVKKYFQDNSGGLLTYSNVVTVYIRAPNPKTYYNDTAVDCGIEGRNLVTDAINAMKALPNYAADILPTFAGLTVDDSSRVVACNVFFAGAKSGVWSYGLWPHSYSLASALDLGNGKGVYSYQISNIGTSLALSTFCHENGHMLCDFPDVYDYDRVGDNYDSKGGAGSFCLMGGGVNSLNPAQINAYFKRAAGWAVITELTSASNLTASLTASTNRFYRYQKPGVSTEYFILENRQKTGRDANIPAAGIAIWHVDELGNRDNQSTNYNSSHLNYELSLMQADNLWHFQNNVNSGDVNDLYYNGNTASGYNNEFTDTSAPSARWWDGTNSKVNFHNFSANAATMTFSIGTSVSLSLSGSPMAESNGVATVRAALSSICAQAVVVNLAFSGTAIQIDYSNSASSITIPAGSLSSSITLTAVQDIVYEGTETIVVDVSSVVNGTTNGGITRVTAIITDDDPKPDDLRVTPSAGVSFVGPSGGTISPSNQVYELTNAGTNALNWSAFRAGNWVILSATNGTLAAGSTTNVTVSANSSALAEGTYYDLVTFTNTTSGLSNMIRQVSLTVVPPYIYFFPLETDPGWARAGEWAFGHPAGQGYVFGPDPADGATGTNVFGVNLMGDYSVASEGGPYYLTAGPLDFSGYTNVSLHFQRWLNTDIQDYVPATIEVSGNGTTWTRIYENNGAKEVVSTNWTICHYNISSIADRHANVYVRWGYQMLYGSSTAWPRSGWNIDDIGFLGTESSSTVYTVTFDAQGGSVSPASATVIGDSTYDTLPTPIRSGYIFGGWWTGANGTGAEITFETTVTITAEQTLYAKWVPGVYTVTFDAQGGSVNPSSVSVTNDSTYGTLPTPTRTGHTFGGWWMGTNGTGTEVTSSTLVAITAAQTLYAKWTIPFYPLIVNGGFGSGSYTNGQLVTITASNATAGKIFDR